MCLNCPLATITILMVTATLTNRDGRHIGTGKISVPINMYKEIKNLK